MPNLDALLARVAALHAEDVAAQRAPSDGHAATAVAALGAVLDAEEERHEQETGNRSPLAPSARAINDVRGLLLRIIGLPGLGDGTAGDLRDRVPDLLRAAYDAELGRLIPQLEEALPKPGAG